MKTRDITQIVIHLSAVTLMTLLGCSGKSFDYHSGNEIPEGPGVFSGQDGEFTIYDSKTGWLDENPNKAQGADRQASEKSGTAEAEGAAVAAGASSTARDETKEFKEFQQWKQEKKEFEDFQKWKESEQGSQAYQEFLEWKKWREFKQWQEGQKKK
jgi:hypothetical protein